MIKYLEELTKKHDLHDVDLVVIKNGSIVCNEIYSHPNIEIPPLKRSDLYRVASISKLFVSIAIMQLEEQGLLDIDNPINNYLDFEITNPNFPDIAITIGHILSHTSSLRDTQHLYVPFGSQSKSLFIKNSDFFDDYIFSNNKPGEQFEYYNTGIQILAIIIERLTSKRFDVYIEDHILKPLGMKGSFNPLEAYTKNHLHPLLRKEDGSWKEQVDSNINTTDYSSYELGTNGSLFSPQGGLRSNANELSKLMLDLFDTKLLKKSTLEKMYHFRYIDTHTKLDDDAFHRNCGLGFNIITNQSINKPIKDLKHTLYGHCGVAYGLLAMFFYEKETKNGIIFSTTGHGKAIDTYKGTYSQFYNFQEEIFTYVSTNIWQNKTET